MDGQIFQNNFDPKKESEEFIHTFDVKDVARYMKVELTKKKIEIKLKKKKAMIYTTTLDEQSVQLTQFNMKSVIEKQVKLDGVNLDIEATIHKAIKGAETERVKVKKMKIKLIPEPFKTLEEQQQQGRKPAAT